MPSFMTLPRELRDQICREVIIAPSTEPPNLELSSDAILERRKSYTRHRISGERTAWTRPGAVKYLPSDTVATSTPLLLVNRQLHAETMANLSIIPQAHTYDLDLILLDEMNLCPTWLRVPALSKTVDLVNVQFRIAGSVQLTDKRLYSGYIGFRSGPGGRFAMGWQIYDVLDRFFKLGPVRERKNAVQSKGIVLKTLNIDVQTPSNVDPRRFKGPKMRNFLGFNGPLVEDSVLHPGYLVNFILMELSMLLAMYRDWADYGRVLYESMNEIVVRRDGILVKQYDMAGLLHELEFDDSFSNVSWPEREPFFVKWKEETMKLREQRGLHVIR